MVSQWQFKQPTEGIQLTKNTAYLCVLMASVLSACGGGGDSGATAGPSAEGAYSGAITGSSTSSAFSAVVLEDGQVWALYGNAIGGGLVVGGIVQGQGISNNGTFTSTTIKDFGYLPPVAGTLDATYVAGASIQGTVTAGGGSIGLSGSAIPSTSFNYNTPALVSNIAGNWTLSSTSGNTIALNIASNGTFTGTATGGCTLSGSVAARPSGKNIFNVQLTNGPAPCALPGFQGNGIGIYTALASGAHQLIVAVIDSSRTYGAASFGTR